LRKDLELLTPEEKIKLAEELKATAEAAQNEPDLPLWFDGKKVDEVAYCEYLLAKQEMRCINRRLYSIDGLIDDVKMQARIATELKPYIRNYLSKTADRVLDCLKLLCTAEPIKPTADRIHFLNGTYFLREGFTPDKEWTMNRLPVTYNPDASPPERWLSFLEELMHEEDVITLQEFLGYAMIATNRGQSMLLIIGNGGEGKSRICAVMQTMFGDNMNVGSISKLEHDKFYPAEQEGKLLFIDDDMKMEALSSSNTIKSMVTCEGRMDMERKGKQCFQGVMYARLLCLGNGTLKALHDKTQGFYRRQIIIQTKDKPKDRIDDPYLKEKLEAEISGIVLWCLDGLKRLVENRYRFSISDRSCRIKRELIAEDNNIQAFLESKGYIAFTPDVQTTTRELYEVYQKWCYDNAEKAMAASTFSRYLHQNAETLGIKPNKNIRINSGKTARGYNGIEALSEGMTDFIAVREGEMYCPF
jgi:putative DNA primase/helicase